jgi:hypothetical protein
MFFAGEMWREDRFDIADKAQIRGIGVEVGCGNTPDVLELRLARQFQTLNMNVGQSNDSASSDGSVIVEVLGNGKQLDIHEIPFDRIQPFEIPIDAVNALKIQVLFEKESCDYGRDTAIAVVSGLTVT